MESALSTVCTHRCRLLQIQTEIQWTFISFNTLQGQYQLHCLTLAVYPYSGETCICIGGMTQVIKFRLVFIHYHVQTLQENKHRFGYFHFRQSAVEKWLNLCNGVVHHFGGSQLNIAVLKLKKEKTNTDPLFSISFMALKTHFQAKKAECQLESAPTPSSTFAKSEFDKNETFGSFAIWFGFTLHIIKHKDLPEGHVGLKTYSSICLIHWMQIWKELCKHLACAHSNHKNLPRKWIWQ